MSDSVSDNPCLAAAGPGENEQRTLGGFHCQTLLRVKLSKKRQAG